jgi:hypothetical protein
MVNRGCAPAGRTIAWEKQAFSIGLKALLSILKSLAES